MLRWPPQGVQFDDKNCHTKLLAKKKEEKKPNQNKTKQQHRKTFEPSLFFPANS